MDQISEEAIKAMPKKPQNAYMLFRADTYDDLRKKNQDKSMTELTSMISSLWGEMDEKKKDVFINQEPFYQKYNKDYDKAMDQYKTDYAGWLKKFKLDDDKVKKFFKDNKQAKKKNKKGSKKVNKTSKQEDESDEEDEQKIQSLKNKNQKKQQEQNVQNLSKNTKEQQKQKPVPQQKEKEKKDNKKK